MQTQESKRLKFHRHRVQIVILSSALLTTLSHTAYAGYSFEPGKDFLANADQWPAWQHTLKRHGQQMAEFRSCIPDPGPDTQATPCSRKHKSLQHLLTRAVGLSGRQKIDLVNRYVNRYRYRRDRPQRRQGKVLRNSWQTLTEFLKRGGDCEDYATAKYFILREMGFAAEDLRVVVGWERANRSYHALLAVNFNGHILFLESDNSIKRGGYRPDYRFTYSLNEVGIWDHKPEPGRHRSM